jgi:hypothetical protein
VVVRRESIVRQQANFGANSAANKDFNRFNAGVFELHSAGDDGFTSTTLASGRLLVVVSILSFAANKGFVRFDVTYELLTIFIAKRHADSVTHQQGGVIRTKAHNSVDLQGAQTLFAGKHHVHNFEPLAQGLVCILKNGANQHRKAVANAIRGARVAIPMMFAGMRLYLGIAAAWAITAFWPTVCLKVEAASSREVSPFFTHTISCNS